MLSPAKQKKIRIYLYMVVLSSQTAYYIIITLLPFLNEYLKTTDFQYSIAFSGYYFTVLLSTCHCAITTLGSLYFGPISDRIGRRKTIVISLAILVACTFLRMVFIHSTHRNVLDTEYYGLPCESNHCWSVRHGSVPLSSHYCRYHDQPRPSKVSGAVGERCERVSDDGSSAWRHSVQLQPLHSSVHLSDIADV